MPSYPPQYFPRFDLAQALSTDSVDPTELAAELRAVADSVNQSIQFIRSLATTQQTFRPVQVQATHFVIDARYDATAGQTVFAYPGALSIDPTTSTVAAFSDGVRIDPDLTTVAATQITLPAQDLGAVVVLEIHENAASVFLRLAQTVADEGASLLGIEDVGGLYAATTVEDALQEVRTALTAFVALVGDLTGYEKLDGSRLWTGAHDANGFKLTGLANGTLATDAVTLGQIQSVLTTLSNLSGTFLALSGGVMAGHINMAGLYRIVSLATPVGSGDAANKAYVDAQVASGSTGKVDLDGTKGGSPVGGTLTGPLTFSRVATDVADADQVTTPDAVTIPTIHGLPKPGAANHAANKQYVDETVAAGGSFVYNREVIFYRDVADGNTTGVVANGSGNYTWTVPADVVGGILEMELVGGGGGGGGGAGNGSGHSGTAGDVGGSSEVLNVAVVVARAVGGPGGGGAPDNDTAAGAPAAPDPASCTGDTKIAPSGAAGSASGGGGGTLTGGDGGRLILPGYIPAAAAAGSSAMAGGAGAPAMFGWGGAGGAGEDLGESGGAGGSSSIFVRKTDVNLGGIALTVQVGTGGTGGVGGGGSGTGGAANVRVGGANGVTGTLDGGGGGGGSPGYVRVRFRQP